jgi:hypothetical protein
MTTAVATERLKDSTLSGPYHNPKGSAARPWCVGEYNGRMSIVHRFATHEDAEAFIDACEG